MTTQLDKSPLGKDPRNGCLGYIRFLQKWHQSYVTRMFLSAAS
jgi:hypothetical protein